MIRKTRHIGNLEYVVSRHILTSGSFVNVAWFDFDNLRWLAFSFPFCVRFSVIVLIIIRNYVVLVNYHQEFPRKVLWWIANCVLDLMIYIIDYGSFAKNYRSIDRQSIRRLIHYPLVTYSLSYDSHGSCSLNSHVH